MRLGVRTLWLIIIICNIIDLLCSYGLYTGYIAITGGFVEVAPIAKIVEDNGVLVLPDLISLKIIGLSLTYWDTKFFPRSKTLILKILASVSLLLVIYEIFILPRLSTIL
ncbi:hypothetical protein J5U23_01643 [Saccharolobus shibatae B12]|uniref:DUF5658 domain-containing protein n=1 Tax=Saccharolobus shibatae (strain ATCC 51178 / DSM 5389 / JCM 8931 / NBRC 15437 / B12) TaxID=523848 RepID=A0A8F5BNV2_SACSH|nr:hypothetical protein [Saccharolobus shibatae]QXJ28774.1 hypothetical protein J5U23_01643 [Saccharolobus shibatae B12]